MEDHVYKVVELAGSSPVGISQAIENAVIRASKTLRHLRWFEVSRVSGHINDDGKVGHYQVVIKAGFTLED
jgi:flavin-binding protein dodecin